MAVLQTTLELIRRRLSEALAPAGSGSPDWVVLSNIIGTDGQPFAGAQDKIVLCLAGIQHETTISTYQATTPTGGDRFAVIAPPLYVNLHLLFYANFSDANYPEGLGMISRTISFFQQNPYFTRDTMPDMDPSIDKLMMEFANLDLLDLNHLMGVLGTKYLPSAYYKLRVIPFRGDAVQQAVPAAQGVKSGGTPQQPVNENIVDRKD